MYGGVGSKAGLDGISNFYWKTAGLAWSDIMSKMSKKAEREYNAIFHRD